MSEPENRPARPAPPKPPASSGAYISPRLREKLSESPGGSGGGGGGDDDFEIKKSSPFAGIILFAVTALVVGGVWWMVQSGQAREKADKQKAVDAARAVEVADSLGRVHMADSLTAIRVADSLAFASLPKAQQKKILADRAKLAAAASGSSGSSSASASAPKPAAAAKSGGASTPSKGGASSSGGAAASSAPAEPPKPAGPFGIDAGQYLDQAKAASVAEALKASAGLAAKVVTIGEGDAATYHVVLGSFASRATAEAKASSLLGKGLVPQASVMALPKN